MQQLYDRIVNPITAFFVIVAIILGLTVFIFMVAGSKKRGCAAPLIFAIVVSLLVFKVGEIRASVQLVRLQAYRW
jgi:heme/copper-type cytochrome/quinol oxidase subunit 4